MLRSALATLVALCAEAAIAQECTPKNMPPSLEGVPKTCEMQGMECKCKSRGGNKGSPYELSVERDSLFTFQRPFATKPTTVTTPVAGAGSNKPRAEQAISPTVPADEPVLKYRLMDTTRPVGIADAYNVPLRYLGTTDLRGLHSLQFSKEELIAPRLPSGPLNQAGAQK